MNANARIVAAMKENEKQVIAAIRRTAKKGRRWQTSAVTTVTWYNAVERLTEKGKIKYVKTRAQFGFNSGYEEVK